MTRTLRAAAGAGLPYLLRFAEPADPAAAPPVRDPAPVDLAGLVARCVPALAARPAAPPRVLLLAYPRNPDAVRLERALLARGQRCLLLGADDFPAGAAVTWTGEGATLRHGGYGVAAADLCGVWYALPTAPSAGTGPVEHFTGREWAEALDGWWRDLAATVVNPPDAAARAGNKLTGLRAAARAGLAVPETLVTNDPEAAAAFLDRHPRVVAKALHSHYVDLGGHRHALYARRVDRRAGLAGLAATPCVLQAEVPRRSEVRVAVVGGRVFAAERDLRGVADLDVRRVARRVATRAHDLPGAVADACVALVAGLGLRYAALDVARTPDDGYVLLDVNPRGGFWAVEDRAGLPVADAVAALLVGAP